VKQLLLFLTFLVPTVRLGAQDSLGLQNQLRWQFWRAVRQEINLEYGRSLTARTEGVVVLNGLWTDGFSRDLTTTNYLENTVYKLTPSGAEFEEQRYAEGEPLADYNGFRPQWGLQGGAGLRYYGWSGHWLRLWAQPLLQLNYHRGVGVIDSFTAINTVTSTCCSNPPDHELTQTVWQQTRTYGSATNRWTGTGLALLGADIRVTDQLYFDVRGGYGRNVGRTQSDGLRSLRRGYWLGRVSLGFNW
jgi:hypothetical protein